MYIKPSYPIALASILRIYINVLKVIATSLALSGVSGVVYKKHTSQLTIKSSILEIIVFMSAYKLFDWPHNNAITNTDYIL